MAQSWLQLIRAGIEEIPGLFRGRVLPISSEIAAIGDEIIPEYINLRSSQEARLATLRGNVVSTPYTQVELPLSAQLGLKEVGEQEARIASVAEDYFGDNVAENIALENEIIMTAEQEAARLDTLIYKEPWLKQYTLNVRNFIAGEIQAGSEVIVRTGQNGISRVRSVWNQVKNSVTRADMLAAALGVASGITIVIASGVLVAVMLNKKGKNEVINIEDRKY